MRIFVLGKVGSITHWLEDCAAALSAEGHEVRIGATRDPRVNPTIEKLALSERIGAPLAAALALAVRRFAPDLILAIGAYHIPLPILGRVAALPGRGPLVGWVGDLFSGDAGASAALLDAVGYTDTGLIALHRRRNLASRPFYLAHAINSHRVVTATKGDRRPMMVLVANPTPHRRAVVSALSAPMTIIGPAWTAFARVDHEIRARRARPEELGGLYAGHLAALNIRNEGNVLDGLNQRNFAPCLYSTPVVAEAQADLAAAFDPGREVLAYRSGEELDEIYARLRACPEEAARVGELGRRRVLAEHTYTKRLETIVRNST